MIMNLNHLIACFFAIFLFFNGHCEGADFWVMKKEANLVGDRRRERRDVAIIDREEPRIPLRSGSKSSTTIADSRGNKQKWIFDNISKICIKCVYKMCEESEMVFDSNKKCQENYGFAFD
ncbi:hypothetical protein ACOME3_002053 [Neoechinorhynchus agilis]